MDNTILEAIARLEDKIDDVQKSVKKMRRNSQIVMWVTVAVVVLPFIGLLFVIPTVIRMYTSSFQGLL